LRHILKAIPQADGTHNVVFAGMSLANLSEYKNWIVREISSRRGQTGRWFTKAIISRPVESVETVTDATYQGDGGQLDAFQETVVVRRLGKQHTKKPQPNQHLTESCIRCDQTGTKVYVSRAAATPGKVLEGKCFNCKGLAWVTPARAKELAIQKAKSFQTLGS